MAARSALKDQVLMALFGLAALGLFVSVYAAYGNASPLEEGIAGPRRPRILETVDVRLSLVPDESVRFEVEAKTLTVRSRTVGGYVLRPYKRAHLQGVRVDRIEKGELRESISSDSGTYDFLLDELRLFGNVRVRYTGNREISCKEARIRIRENRIGIVY